MRIRQASFRLLRRSMALAGCFTAWLAVAGDTPTAPTTPTQPWDFNIPAGPLVTTLLEIANRTNTLVSFDPSLVQAITAPAVQGRLTLPQALALATQSSGLSIQISARGVVTLSATSSPAAQAASAPASAPAVQPPPLPASVAVLPPVVVHGQRTAFDAQEANDQIVNVLRSEDIRQLPSQNAAEALQRLPGISIERDMGDGRYVTVRGLSADLNSVFINGTLVPSPERNVRGVMMDVLPSTLLQSMQVTKTLTPDQDGGSLGGSVDVRTISAFDLGDKALTLDASAAHDGNTGQVSPNFSLLGAKRMMNGRLGVALGLSVDRRRFGADSLEADGAWNGPLLEEFERRDYRLSRAHEALSLNVDYRPEAGHRYHLRAFTSRLKDTELRDTHVIKFPDGQAAGTTGDAEVKRKLKERLEIDRITSVVLGSEHRLGSWTLDTSAAISRASEETPLHLSSAVFDAGTVQGVGYRDTRQPDLQGPGSLYDVSLYQLQRIDVKSTFTRDNERNARIDLGRAFTLAQFDGAVKLGAKTSRRKKIADEESFSYEADDLGGPQPMSAFLGGSIDYAFGPFTPGLNPVALQNLVNQLNPANFRNAVESLVDDYAVTENVDAAYAQGMLEFNAWRVLTGLRYEDTRFTAQGSGFDGAQFVPVAVQRREVEWLPSLHVRRDLDARTSVRAAWSTAVVRPSFGQAGPGFRIESDEGELEAAFGNPNLRSMRSVNVDLGMERRLGDRGIVSAYAFSKRIKNFIYRTDFAGLGGFADFKRALTFVNGEQAHVAGVELAYIPVLTHLPAPWNGLLLGVNASFATSQARIAGVDPATGMAGTRTISLPGQSTAVVNLTMGYETGPFSLRVAANHRSPYLLEVRAPLDSTRDLVVGSQTQVDLSVQYRLNRRLSLSAEGLNLTNAPYYIFNGSEALGSTLEQYGRTWRVGLRASLFPD